MQDRREPEATRIAAILFFAVMACLVHPDAVFAEPEDDPITTEHLLEWFVRPDTASWREAEIRLAAGGLTTLASVEATLDKIPVDLHYRLKDLVAMALLKSIQVEELDKLPRLKRLVKADIEAATAWLMNKCENANWISGDMPVMTYRDRTGFHIPGAIKLLKNDNPFARAIGARLLHEMGATIALDQMLAATNDAGKVRIKYDDYEKSVSVGHYVREILRLGSEYVWRVKSHEKVPGLLTAKQWERLKEIRGKTPDVPQLDYSQFAISFEIEEYVHIAISQEGQTFEAANLLNGGIRGVFARRPYNATIALEWWHVSRPVWKYWWDHSGKGTPPDKEQWWAYLRSLEKTAQQKR